MFILGDIKRVFLSLFGILKVFNWLLFDNSAIGQFKRIVIIIAMIFREEILLISEKIIFHISNLCTHEIIISIVQGAIFWIVFCVIIYWITPCNKLHT